MLIFSIFIILQTWISFCQRDYIKGLCPKDCARKVLERPRSIRSQRGERFSANRFLSSDVDDAELISTWLLWLPGCRLLWNPWQKIINSFDSTPGSSSTDPPLLTRWPQTSFDPEDPNSFSPNKIQWIRCNNTKVQGRIQCGRHLALLANKTIDGKKDRRDGLADRQPEKGFWQFLLFFLSGNTPRY